MRFLARLLFAKAFLVSLLPARASADPIQNYFGTAGSINGTTWSTSPGGPFGSAFAVNGEGGVMNFLSDANITGGTLAGLAAINADANVTLTSPTGTVSNINNGIATVTVGSGFYLDFGTQGFTSSATAGYVKNGEGVFATSGGTYQGGFTLNAGMLIARGNNAFGCGTNNTLTINGGTLAATGPRSLTDRFGGGVFIGGNFTFGAAAAASNNNLANVAASVSFNNNVDLLSGNRVITIGGTGAYSFNSVISNSTAGITIGNTAAGTINFGGNASNTYSGTTRLTGGTLGLNKTAGAIAIPGDLAQTGGVVIMRQNNQLAPGANYTINGAGAGFDGNGTDQAFGNVTIILNQGTGGSVQGFRTGSGTGTLTVAGTLDFQGGGITLNSGGSTLFANTLNFSGGSFLLGTSSGTQRVIVGSGGLTMSIGSALSLPTGTSAGGNLILNGDVTVLAYTSSATITRSGTAVTGGVLDLNNGTRSFNVANGAAANDLVVSAIIANGTLTKTGAGVMVISGPNTYTGTTTVNAGNLTYGASNVIATGNVTVDGASAVLDLSTFSDTIGTLTLANGSVRGTATLTATGSFEMQNGTASIALAGAGIELHKTTAGTVTLTGSNTYTGATTLDGGVLRQNGSLAGAGGAVNVNAGTLSGNGSISGTGRLVTIAPGARVLGGDSTSYPRGTLTLAAGLALQGDPSNGAALQVNFASLATPSGANIAASKIDVLSSDLNFLTGAGKLTIELLNDTALTLNAPFSVVLASAASSTNFKLNGVSFTTISGSDFGNNFNLVSSHFATFDNISLNVTGTSLVLTATPTPEPGTILGLGALGLVATRVIRRRRKLPPVV